VIVPGSPFEPDDPIVHDEDLSSLSAVIPASYRLRGMFFSRLAAKLPAEVWAGFAPSLREPPDGGRYVAFQSYPYADYHELLLAVGASRYPTLSACEGLRRIGRDDFATYTESMVGRVSLRLIRDARAALLRLPGIYEAMASGEWKVAAREVDDRTVRLEFDDFFGAWPYQVGQIEEIVRRLGGRSRIEVLRPHLRALRLDITHR